ncbi:MAG: SLC13 family permease [Candidatus Thiodiazotropha sp.]
MHNLTPEMWASAAVLVAAYALIFTETLHRTTAAILGAVAMIGVGMYMGFYSQEQAVFAVDANTILLLAAMMMLVALLRPTGAFDFDLMAEAMLSNIGGAATLVGDPPNLMIGSAGGISFNSFLLHMGLPVLVVWVTSVGLMLLLFRKQLEQTGADPKALVATHAIKDPEGLRRILFALAVVVVLFFIHHALHVLPAYASFIGLTLALLLMRPDMEKLFSSVNWSVLFFFSALFMIVGGVEASGLLELLGHELAKLAKDPDKLLMTGLLLMWVAAILSAVVDNIPFTVTMIPIILGLESSGVNIAPLWWALALGVGLGGNGTHIGATANIIAVSESEKSGMLEAKITPLLWLRTGLPVMLVGLLAASLAYWLLFALFLTA